MSEMFEDIKGVEVVVDDLLIWGESGQQHDDRLMQVLDRAKFKVEQTEVPNKKEQDQLRWSHSH